MKKILLLVFFHIIINNVKSQVEFGVGSIGFSGTDSKNLELKSALRINLACDFFIPVPVTDSLGLLITIEPGIYWDKYYFDQNIIPESTNGHTFLNEDTNPNHEYRNNLFSYKTLMQSSNINLPLKIYFPVGKKILGSVGANVSYMVDGKFKQKYFTDNEKIINKNSFNFKSNEYNLNRLQYGLDFSLHYNNFVLFGGYSLSKVFKENKGPDIHLYVIGLGYTFLF